METTTSKTVFIEYSTARKGQHFMTVVQTLNHERVIIGRIYRDYNPETKKTYYRAYDFDGNQIFFNVQDISELKNKFKKTGRMLAEGKIATQKVAKEKNAKFPPSQNAIRKNDIQAIRDKKIGKDKEKTKNPDKQNTADKAKLNQMEKEQDSKNSVKYANEKSPDQAKAGISSENSKPEEQNKEPEIEKSDREMELEEIRADNDDREQDIDGPDQGIDL
jgi:hypothetical protein